MDPAERQTLLIRALGVLASSSLPDAEWDQIEAARAAGDRNWRDRARTLLGHHDQVYLNRVDRYCERAVRRDKLLEILRALWLVAKEGGNPAAAGAVEALGRHLRAGELGPGAAARELLKILDRRRWDLLRALGELFR